MVVTMWPYESRIYPLIDAAEMRGESEVSQKFEIGEGQLIDVKIFTFDKSPLNLHHEVDPNNIGFSTNFRSGGEPWFRIDNDHGFLHYHLQSGAQPFKEHIPITEVHTVSGLVSLAFIEAEKILKWKCPDIAIEKGKGFVGFC